ncbi:MAG: hypothetical protein Q7J12_08885 [Syntrophales bacterium]|nr:hypothetical protein [Syntrophales bacterium]
MATPEAIRTQILALVKDYHTAKFAPKTFDPDKNLVHYASRVFDAEEIITGVKAIFSGNERLARQASIYLCHKYSGGG